MTLEREGDGNLERERERRMEIGRDRENLFGEGILTEISLLGHGKNFSFFPFRENERGREEDRRVKDVAGRIRTRLRILIQRHELL